MSEWRDIPGFPKYMVSRDGRILSKSYNKTGVPRVMLPNVVKGYHVIQLTGRKRVQVHHAVCAAFIGPRPTGKDVNHKNGIKNDNRVENLEYVTRSENSKHAYATGLGDNHGENHSQHKLTNKLVAEIRSRISRGDRNVDIAKDVGVDQSNISHIKRGRLWTHLAACEGGVPFPG